MKRLSILACCAALLGCDDAGQDSPSIDLELCQREHIVVDGQGVVRLESIASSGVVTHGTITCEYKVPRDRWVSTLSVRGRSTPTLPSDSPYISWPMLTTDVITQTRFRRADGSYGPWEPRNVLDGGDFADSNGNGIPDEVNVLVGETDQNWSLYADQQVIGPRPSNFWLPPEKVVSQASMVDPSDHPEGLGPSLHLHKPWTGGQQLAS